MRNNQYTLNKNITTVGIRFGNDDLRVRFLELYSDMFVKYSEYTNDSDIVPNRKFKIYDRIDFEGNEHKWLVFRIDKFKWSDICKALGLEKTRLGSGRFCYRIGVA